MPAFPKFCSVSAEVGRFEVQVQPYAKKISDANCHFTISRKIEIELEGIEIGGYPCLHCSQRCTGSKKVVGINSNRISDNDFLK